MSETKKAYFRQAPPDQQESQWDFYSPAEEWPGIYIAGNRHFNGLRGDFLRRLTDTAEEQIDDFAENGDTDAPDGGNRETWAAFIRQCTNDPDSMKSGDRDWAVQVLSAYHGRPYDWRAMRGSDQSDWNYCYYPAEGCPQAPNIHNELDRLDADYFNTCTEFYLLDGPDGEIECCGFYTYNAYDIPSYAAELRAYGEGEPVISLFERYKQTPVWGSWMGIEEEIAA